MALRSDNQGFLVGNPVDISGFVDELKSIRSDVAEIKRAALGMAANVHDNRNRDSLSSQSSAGNNGAATPNRPRSSNTSSSDGLPPVNPNGTVTPNGRGRDTSGRFSGNGESSSESATRNNDDRKSQGIISGFTDRIATAVKASAAGAEEADPTIKAFQEVAEPMRRGYEIFSGGGDKKDRWYKKIFKELNLFRKDDTAFNRAANRSLHNIEGNPGGGDGEGGQSFLGGLLGSISPWIMAAITGIGGALLTGITAVLGVIFSPIGLAISAIGIASWGLFTESGQKFFGEVGAKIIAGWDGVVTAFTPVSESISKGWDTVKGGFDSLINGMVSSWDAFTGFLKDKFGIDIPAIFKPVVDVSKKVIDATEKAAKPVVDAVKDTVKSGVDIAKNTAGKAVDAVAKSSPKTMEALGNAKDWVLGKTSQLFESGKGGAGTVSSGKGDNGGASYGTYQLSSKQGTLQNFLKSSKYGAQFDGLSPGSKEFNDKWKQTAKDDPDFGNSQHEFIKNTHFDPQMEKLKKSGIDLSDRGSAVKDSVWSTSVQFGGKSSLIEKALKDKDVSKMADADIVSAIQDYKIANNDKLFAKSSDDVRSGTLNRASKEKDKLLSLASDESSQVAENLKAMPSLADDPTQGGRYKYETLEGGKVQVTDSQDGAISLASDEQANAFRKQEGKQYLDNVAAINANDMPAYYNLAAGPVNTQVQTASATSPRVPTFAPHPAIGEAPPVIQPLTSDSNRNLTVTMPTPDVGQDVRDRNIAHIVTGGLSGRG